MSKDNCQKPGGEIPKFFNREKGSKGSPQASKDVKLNESPSTDNPTVFPKKGSTDGTFNDC